MDCTLYLAIGSCPAGLGIRVIAAVQLDDIAFGIFDSFITFYDVTMLLNNLYLFYKLLSGFYDHQNILHFPKIQLAKTLTNHA